MYLLFIVRITSKRYMVGYHTLLTSLATQHVASEVMFFGTNIVFLDRKGVG